MPLYEYKCKSCGETFEALQKFSDAPIGKHEKCGGTVERLVSVPSFQFKGTGWYVTDYGKGRVNGSQGTNGNNGKNGSAKSGSDSSKSASETASTPSTTTSKPPASNTTSSK
jgi:putative FmdB family regulatory protein